MKSIAVTVSVLYYICWTCSVFCRSSASARCPVSRHMDSPMFHKEWSNDKVNVTVQCLHDSGEEVSVNYIVQHSKNIFFPITVDIFLDGYLLAAFRCENGSVVDTAGMGLVQVVFKEYCKDPSVIVNKHLTVDLSLDLDVQLNDDERRCNTVTIGPQRLNLSSELDPDSGQEIVFLQLWNVDKCHSDKIGPDVPILLLASTNASILLHPDGHTETVGDISVQHLNCTDNHTQVYQVSVPSTADYTLCAEILSALLLKSCISLNVPNVTDPPMNQAPLLIVEISAGIVTGSLVVIVLAGATCVTVTIICCIRNKRRGGTTKEAQGCENQRSELQLGEWDKSQPEKGQRGGAALLGRTPHHPSHPSTASDRKTDTSNGSKRFGNNGSSGQTESAGIPNDVVDTDF